jgi:DNA helicase-2/ATP-dependent DNA helicase PcrA
MQMWKQEKTPEAAGRVENLKELSRAIGEFESIAAFLEHVSLVTEASNSDNSNDMISLMTLHAAKGLEFDTVFLPGWEEGVFPHQRALDEAGTKGLEEERRLAYVGITRARKKLYISHAANRRIYNQWQSSIPSRFIGEIPGENIEQLGGGAVNMAKSAMNWASDVANILSSRVSQPEAEGKFKKGQRIFHQKFGYGIILGISGNTLEISFDKAGQKKLLADFVEII